jgi:acyl-CoA thioester hydrolase
MMPGDGANSGFVVRDIKASFLGTSTLGDVLDVSSKILSQKSSSMVLLQEIYKEEKKIFSMEIVLVYIAEGRPRRIPETFREIFDSF